MDKPPPAPLPELLWGKEWRFATLAAGDVVETFSDRRFQLMSFRCSIWSKIDSELDGSGFHSTGNQTRIPTQIFGINRESNIWQPLEQHLERNAALKPC